MTCCHLILMVNDSYGKLKNKRVFYAKVASEEAAFCFSIRTNSKQPSALP